MKRTLSIMVCLGMLMTTHATARAAEKAAAGASGPNAVIEKIKMFREAGEKKLVENKFTRKEVSLKGVEVEEAIRQKWSKMDAYYEGSTLVRLQLYPHEGISGRTEEFYLMGDKLVFAFIQDKSPKHEGRDMGEPGKELYFENNRLIRFDDRSGEKSVNIEMEKKMYEASLPYEVAGLLPILAAAK